MLTRGYTKTSDGSGGGALPTPCGPGTIIHSDDGIIWQQVVPLASAQGGLLTNAQGEIVFQLCGVIP